MNNNVDLFLWLLAFVVAIAIIFEIVHILTEAV